GAVEHLVIAGDIPEIDRRRRRPQAADGVVETLEGAFEAAAQDAEEVGGRQRRVAGGRLLDARHHTGVLATLHDRVDGRAGGGGGGGRGRPLRERRVHLWQAAAARDRSAHGFSAAAHRRRRAGGREKSQAGSRALRRHRRGRRRRRREPPLPYRRRG